MPPNPHDALFKWTFSQPELAAAELRAVLPPALVARLDLERLVLAEGSFVDRDLQGSHADRLFSGSCVRGGLETSLLH
jgi:predicted transposase YdaD